MTERVKLDKDTPLMKDVLTIDWSKHIQYGTIEILLSAGKVVLLTRKDTEKPKDP